VKRNPKDRWRPLKILDCRWHKDEVVVFTDLGPTRTDIELWRGAEVGIPAHRLVSKPEEGVVYWDDLKGRRIETADGVYLGTIEYIYCAGASDVMSLEGVEPLDIPLVDDFIDLKKIPSDRHQTVALKVTQDFIRPLLRDAPNAQSDHSPESFP
jgi:ribosomal 30S subunit maturation factor RimM